jgi:membrane protein
MAPISVSETEPVAPSLETALEPTTALAVRAADQGPLPIYGFEWKRDGKLLLHYVLDSEVHTFAFSVAANAILSFIPFIVLLYTMARGIFRSQAMVQVTNDMVKYLLPLSPSSQDWVAQHLAAVAPHRGVRVISLVMILVSCTGIFLPLEVALNRSWGWAV